MNYDPNIHHRRSIRLKGYDYSQAGAYFITICAQNREYLFGEITNGKMQLNNAGKMIEKWYCELMNKFPDIQCGEHVVMPNHFHCIIHNVGADLCVCPNENTNADLRVCPDEMGQSHRIAPTDTLKSGEHTDMMGEHAGPPHADYNKMGEHTGSPLRDIVQWFKTMTTNEYMRHAKQNRWRPFNGKLWQRNYYEHIIRNENDLNQIREYIINNPLKWELDNENPSI